MHREKIQKGTDTPRSFLGSLISCGATVVNYRGAVIVAKCTAAVWIFLPLQVFEVESPLPGVSSPVALR
jgi:hypothetical protein